MGDEWIGITIIVIVVALASVIVVGANSQITKETELREASQSAQIQIVCERDYKEMSYKNVPIKCLDFWGFTKKQEEVK